MKCLLSLSLVTLAVAANLALSNSAQSPALPKGINVELAVSSNAIPMPDADNENAVIVTVTNDGKIYFGVNQIALPDLKAKIRSTPLQRGQKIYIKADARTPYARVLEVLDATPTVGLASQVLLTAHTGPSTPGTIAPPEGVEVQLGARLRNSL
jgi:biopolymer transport protein ExbD/biopolymer transport protein TolR